MKKGQKAGIFALDKLAENYTLKSEGKRNEEKKRAGRICLSFVYLHHHFLRKTTASYWIWDKIHRTVITR